MGPEAEHWGEGGGMASVAPVPTSLSTTVSVLVNLLHCYVLSRRFIVLFAITVKPDQVQTMKTPFWMFQMS
jgi:hypothetical protein